MNKDTKIEMLNNRIALLEARKKDNANIIKALKREVRKLEK